jgi:hypothetical protein
LWQDWVVELGLLRGGFVMATFDLVNWTMQTARQLNPVNRAPREAEGSQVLRGELIKATDLSTNPQEKISRVDNFPNFPLSDDKSIAALADELADGNEANAVSDFPVSTHAAPLVPADVPAIPMSALLKAVVKPDIYTSPSDRERAITLRWILRDIKANRLKLSPVDELDLRELIEMGLVETRNDVPVLTSAGIRAIL